MNHVFVYKYSAKENAEVQEIRKKYLPREESKLEELKRLDRAVQTSGVAESLGIGIIGALIFGLGMCLSMKVLGNGGFLIVLGVLLGIVGAIGMMAAFPVYKKVYLKTKEMHTPRILALAAELSGEKVNSDKSEGGHNEADE